MSVNGGYQYQENRYQAFQGLWMVNAGVQWKLYDGSTQHQSDAMKRQAIALKEQCDDLGSQVALQVKQAWLDGLETQQRLAVAGQTIAQAEENMKVTRPLPAGFIDQHRRIESRGIAHERTR